MDAISGNELKIRGFETPVRTTVVSDQRILVDGPQTGPGNLSPADTINAGLTQLPIAVVPPTWPATARPSIAVSRFDSQDPTTGSYPLADLLTTVTPYYLGPFQFNPSVNNQGGPLVAGNTYFNTLENTEYVFTSGGNWVPIGSGAPSTLKAYYYFPVVDSFQIPPAGPGTPDAHGSILSFDISGGAGAADQILVYMNGALQCNGQDYVLHEGSSGSGDYITTIRNLCAGSVVEVLTFARPVVVFGTSAQAVDTSIWVLNGVTRTFPLQTPGAVAIVPESTVNCLVSINNRIANPYTEFTVLGSNITFLVAPAAGTAIWLVIGQPVSGGTTFGAFSALAVAPDTAVTDQLTLLQGQVAALQTRIETLESP